MSRRIRIDKKIKPSHRTAVFPSHNFINNKIRDLILLEDIKLVVLLVLGVPNSLSMIITNKDYNKIEALIDVNRLTTCRREKDARVTRCGQQAESSAPGQ